MITYASYDRDGTSDLIRVDEHVATLVVSAPVDMRKIAQNLTDLVTRQSDLAWQLAVRAGSDLPEHDPDAEPVPDDWDRRPAPTDPVDVSGAATATLDATLAPTPDLWPLSDLPGVCQEVLAPLGADDRDAVMAAVRGQVLRILRPYDGVPVVANLYHAKDPGPFTQVLINAGLSRLTREEIARAGADWWFGPALSELALLGAELPTWVADAWDEGQLGITVHDGQFHAWLAANHPDL